MACTFINHLVRGTRRSSGVPRKNMWSERRGNIWELKTDAVYHKEGKYFNIVTTHTNILVCDNAFIWAT